MEQNECSIPGKFSVCSVVKYCAFFQSVFLLPGLVLILLMLQCIPVEAATEQELSRVVKYPAPTGEKISTVYRVVVNGTEIPVVAYNGTKTGVAQRIAYTHFDFAGKVTVEVTAINRTIPNSFILSPKSYNIPVTHQGSKITFTLERPRKLALHYGGKYGMDNAGGIPEKLFIFADPLEDQPVTLTSSNTVNLDSHSPNKTGTANASPAIQAAINATPAGGTMYIPPGRYRIDTRVNLKSGVTVYLAGGAILIAPTHFGSAGMLHGDGATNVTIRGRGVIDAYGSIHYKSKGYGSPSPYRIYNSQNASVRDVILLDSANSTYVGRSPNTLLYNIKVITDDHNADGIDLMDFSHNSLIDNVFVHSTDDGTAVGLSGQENFTVRNSVFWPRGTGAPFKTAYVPKETQTYRNFTHENNDIILAQELFGITTWGTMTQNNTTRIHNYYYKNNRLEAMTNRPFRMYIPSEGANIFDFYIDHAYLPATLTEAGEPDYQKQIQWYGFSNTAKIYNIHFNNYYKGTQLISSYSQFRSSYGFTNNSPFVENVTFGTQAKPEVTINTSTLFVSRSGGTGTFTVSRTQPYTSAITVPLVIRGTAVNGTDYDSIPASVTIPAGSASTTIIIRPKTSGKTGTHTVFISLGNQPLATAWMLGPNYHAVINITDGTAPTGSVPSPTTPVTAIPTSPACPQKSQGDADCNGVINLADFEQWRKEFMGTVATKSADFDGNGTVNLVDFEIWRKSYLQ